MNMPNEKVVLCGANSYSRKYYLNPRFEILPDQVKDELKIMCVIFTEDIGGIITLVFDENGELQFQVEAALEDYLFDEIGSGLKIKQLQTEKRELLAGIQMFYTGLKQLEEKQ